MPSSDPEAGHSDNTSLSPELPTFVRRLSCLCIHPGHRCPNPGLLQAETWAPRAAAEESTWPMGLQASRRQLGSVNCSRLQSWKSQPLRLLGTYCLYLVSPP